MCIRDRSIWASIKKTLYMINTLGMRRRWWVYGGRGVGVVVIKKRLIGLQQQLSTADDARGRGCKNIIELLPPPQCLYMHITFYTLSTEPPPPYNHSLSLSLFSQLFIRIHHILTLLVIYHTARARVYFFADR